MLNNPYEACGCQVHSLTQDCTIHRGLQDMQNFFIKIMSCSLQSSFKPTPTQLKDQDPNQQPSSSCFQSCFFCFVFTYFFCRILLLYVNLLLLLPFSPALWSNHAHTDTHKAGSGVLSILHGCFYRSFQSVFTIPRAAQCSLEIHKSGLSLLSSPQITGNLTQIFSYLQSL